MEELHQASAVPADEDAVVKHCQQCRNGLHVGCRKKLEQHSANAALPVRCPTCRRPLGTGTAMPVGVLKIATSSSDEPPAKRAKPASVLVSGGALGADLRWAQAAAAAGCAVRVMSFAGHKVAPQHPHEAAFKHLKESDIQAARKCLAVAARQLGKGAPNPASYTGKLLARNFNIAKTAEAMYAVGSLLTLNPLNGSVGVDGGTGWACQLFANRLGPTVDGALPLFLFSTTSVPARGWYQCFVARGAGYAWHPCPVPPSPTTFSVFAGVGTRQMTPEGSNAIAELLQLIGGEP